MSSLISNSRPARPSRSAATPPLEVSPRGPDIDLPASKVYSGGGWRVYAVVQHDVLGVRGHPFVQPLIDPDWNQRNRGRGTLSSSERPLSPHLQVYRPQLTSVLSILHRLTGIFLALGTLLLVWWLVAAAAGPEAYGAVQWFLGSWLGYLLLFGWSVAFFYHLCNGIRHLVWDAGYGLELEDVYRSGWAVVIATAALTVIAWIAGLILL